MFDLREKFGDPGLENFAADKTDLRMAFGLNSKMFARAKTDLEPNVSSRSPKSPTEIKSACFRDGQTKPRQQFANPEFLSCAQPSPMTASENQRTVRQPQNNKKSESTA